MKVYLDSHDFHSLDVTDKDKDNYKLSKEPLRAKPKLHGGGIAAILYSFTMIGIVTGFTIYTLMEILFS